MPAEWAARYVGVPFKSGGRGMDGVDCYGLLWLVYKEQFSAELPSLEDAYKNALDTRETAPLAKKYIPLLRGDRTTSPKPSDAAVMLEHGLPTHIGIYAGDGYILHATRRLGVILQRTTHPDLRGRVEGYYAVKASNTDSSVFGKIRRPRD